MLYGIQYTRNDKKYFYISIADLIYLQIITPGTVRAFLIGNMSSSSSQYIGKRVRVYWASEENWFHGVIDEYDSSQGYHIIYLDGDDEWLMDFGDIVQFEEDFVELKAELGEDAGDEDVDEDDDEARGHLNYVCTS